MSNYNLVFANTGNSYYAIENQPDRFYTNLLLEYK